MSQRVIVVINNELWYYLDEYLQQEEWRILQERQLIPSWLWDTFGIGKATLEDIQVRLKQLEDDSK